MGALRQDGLADETVGPNITWLDLKQFSVQIQMSESEWKKVKWVKVS
jgi:hypothetical protein